MKARGQGGIAAVVAPPVVSAARRQVVEVRLPGAAGDYETALARAQADGKPLLLIFTAQWSAYSRQLCDEALADADVRSAIDAFVPLVIDVDRQPQLCEQYLVNVYPTVILASPQGTTWKRLVGAQSAATLAAGLTSALTAMADRRVADEAVQR